jgi:hypothetical protein
MSQLQTFIYRVISVIHPSCYRYYRIPLHYSIIKFPLWAPFCHLWCTDYESFLSLLAERYHENEQYIEAHKKKTGTVRINVTIWRVRATIAAVEKQ